MTDERSDPTALLATYNQVLTSNGLSAKRMRMTPKKRGGPTMWIALEAFGVWCIVADVDPERWILARHEAIGWRHRIAIERLASAKFLVKFREFGDDRQHAAQSQDRLADAVVDDVPQDGSEMRSLWETMKRSLAMDKEVCRASQDMTGGYDARSPWCEHCPLAQACAGDLHPGVHALRMAAYAGS